MNTKSKAKKPRYTVSAKVREQRHAAGKRSAVARKAVDKWLTCAVGATNKAWCVAQYGSVNEAITAFRRQASKRTAGKGE